jgi:hypothetical protein
LGVRYDSTPINTQTLLTEPFGPHNTELKNIKFES